jgi:hypothetical protein
MNLENITKQITDLFNGNPYLNLFSLLLAILGIIFTIYFYFKSKKNRNPTYIIRTINLVKEKIQKIETVEIKYGGEIVENLSISKIALWNDGKETINSNDVANNNKIKIKINNDYRFLDAEILFQKNEASDFKCFISNDNLFINIEFDYFDYEEGVVLQIFHTGNESNDLFIDGKIKSVKKIIRKQYGSTILPNSFYNWLRKDDKIINPRILKSTLGWTVIFGGILIFCLTFLRPSFLETEIVEVKKSNAKDLKNLIILFPAFLYMLMGYRMVKRNIPKGFDVFNEEM